MFEYQQFLSHQTQRMMDYVASVYGNHVEYLWAKSPDAGALRHSDTKKWYGVLMTLDYVKLDSKCNERVEVLNLKQDRVSELLATRGIYPAFHMNKKYWISLVLDDTLSDDSIISLIDSSWKLTKK